MLHRLRPDLFLLMFVLVWTHVLPTIVQAADPFLTLPFPSHADMKIVQGWCYDFVQRGVPTPCPGHSPKTSLHRGVDYIKKPGLGLSPYTQWQSFPVLAAADGYACGNCTGRSGNAVWIRHIINGVTYYTYYGHLNTISGNIPIGSQSKTVFVKRGAPIGMAGDTGTGNSGLIHLHFQVQRGSTVVDPYDLYTTKEAYPDPNRTNGKVSGPSQLWTATPLNNPRLVHMYINDPLDGATLQGQVTVRGWAIDQAANSGTGVDQVWLYLDGEAGAGQAMSVTTYGVERPDVAAVYGERYRYSGYQYRWNTSTITPGQHTLYVYVHSTVSGWSFYIRPIRVQAPAKVYLPLAQR
jgi:hypothetical protein